MAEVWAEEEVLVEDEVAEEVAHLKVRDWDLKVTVFA
jgi:hypothetical protein